MRMSREVVGPSIQNFWYWSLLSPRMLEKLYVPSIQNFDTGIYSSNPPVFPD